MTSTPITISVPPDDRFSRFRLIQWWDQEKLAGAKVLVVGAGALGNEILKNLALLGVGNVLVADMDRVENSNLSRSVLYRASDNGRFKAEVAAAAARDLYPEINAHAFVGNVVYDLGMGVFRWADVVLGGLDNREARLAINRGCWKVGTPWIDGAIEHIQGVARVFVPPRIADPSIAGDVSSSDMGAGPVPADGPCYECTMSATDWKLLATRRSCNLLSRSEMEQGKTPTTPTIGSIIAGVQCQEAVKLLHGMETLAGRGWVFTGMTGDSYTIEYQRNMECLSHDPFDEVVTLDHGVATLTVGGLLEIARRRLGPDAVLELGRDVLEKLACPRCKAEEELFASLGRVSASKAYCPNCGDVRREVKTFHRITGDERFLGRTLAAIGAPPFDIVTARTGSRSIGLELSADARAVLGPLAASRSSAAGEGAEALEWA